MSQENVEIVRRMYEAFNRGDFEGSTQTLHPAAELHQPSAMADSDSYYGRDRVRPRPCGLADRVGGTSVRATGR